MSAEISANLFDDLVDYFTRLPDVAEKAAQLAINDTVRGDAMQLARHQMMEEVNFSSAYLRQRLTVEKFARPGDLEAILSGRDRPTSLARFATNAKAGQRGVTVQVRKGSSKVLKKAFIINLKNGNLGLAIRLGPGETLSNKTFPATVFSRSLGGSVVLLYGPSVDQVFQSVAGDIQPAVADAAAAQFFRQFARLSNG